MAGDYFRQMSGRVVQSRVKIVVTSAQLDRFLSISDVITDDQLSIPYRN